MYIYLVEQRGFSALNGGWANAIPWLAALVLSPFGGLAYIAGEHAGLVSGIMNTAGILGGVLSTSIVPVIVNRAGWLSAFATGTGMDAVCVIMWIGVRSGPGPVRQRS